MLENKTKKLYFNCNLKFDNNSNNQLHVIKVCVLTATFLSFCIYIYIYIYRGMYIYAVCIVLIPSNYRLTIQIHFDLHTAQGNSLHQQSTYAPARVWTHDLWNPLSLQCSSWQSLRLPLGHLGKTTTLSLMTNERAPHGSL